MHLLCGCIHAFVHRQRSRTPVPRTLQPDCNSCMVGKWLLLMMVRCVLECLSPTPCQYVNHRCDPRRAHNPAPPTHKCCSSTAIACAPAAPSGAPCPQRVPPGRSETPCAPPRWQMPRPPPTCRRQLLLPFGCRASGRIIIGERSRQLWVTGRGA